MFWNAVSRRLVSDVPVGAFLSGGIDSSMVVAMMAEVSAGRPSTFNISFSDKDFDESVYAEKVAKAFNTRHTKIELQPESFLLELENALDAMDSPSGDGINAFVVSKAVHNTGIKVALSGVGGDELFARYPFFKTYLQLQKAKPIFDHSAWIREKKSPACSLKVVPGKITGSGHCLLQKVYLSAICIRNFVEFFLLHWSIN